MLLNGNLLQKQQETHTHVTGRVFQTEEQQVQVDGSRKVPGVSIPFIISTINKVIYSKYFMKHLSYDKHFLPLPPHARFTCC